MLLYDLQYNHFTNYKILDFMLNKSLCIPSLLNHPNINILAYILQKRELYTKYKNEINLINARYVIYNKLLLIKKIMPHIDVIPENIKLIIL